MSEFHFTKLTPELILDGIESLGIQVSSGLLALNSYENRVYQFVSEEQRRYVVKFYRPLRWTDEQILEEHQFSQRLKDEDISVVAPLSLNGKTLHEINGYRFTLFESVGGRQFEVDNLDQLESVGRMLGRIHRVGHTALFEHRLAISIETHLSEPRKTLQAYEIVPAHLQQPFYVILDQLIERTTEYYQAAINNIDGAIRLHADVHPGNILWRDGPMLVDFDDCRNGPAIQDLWMMLSGDRQQQLLQLDVLVSAYEEFHDLDPKELHLIEPLRAMRMVHYMAWLAVRWQDPAFPQAFPWFGEDKYWEGQILALKEQFAALDEPPLSLLPQY
ncbi:serine/threonine protein kinase [Glaciecola sp. XM2]|uniref:serine/threonine protein kinase n=1 Tax=Glaciecola sp. XM2 TaxID=1914931 RepID=UPI001BDF30AB|nr:serine/threonine protein kinase [Glaciecola sp. XM2]